MGDHHEENFGPTGKEGKSGWRERTVEEGVFRVFCLLGELLLGSVSVIVPNHVSNYQKLDRWGPGKPRNVHEKGVELYGEGDSDRITVSSLSK